MTTTARRVSAGNAGADRTILLVPTGMEGFSDPAALVTADNDQPCRSGIGREGQTYDMLHAKLRHDSDRINH